MRTTLLLLTLFLYGLPSFSQRLIQGTVTDQEGSPLVGANVVSKNSLIGTSTDQNGYFRLTLKEQDSLLVVSYIGFVAEEVPIGTSNILDLILTKGVDFKTMVVTALGIERSEKSISYAVQQIESQDLNIVRQSSPTNALAGKVAGVQVIGSSGVQTGYGSGARIRGVGSLGGSKSPLYIVDGTPVSTTPGIDDIESISVLKGPAATALYGQRGDGGAVIITTKGARKTNGIGIEINQSTFFEDIFRLPEYQNLYAGGSFSELQQFQWKDGMPEEWKVFEGKFYHDYSDDTSWGPKMEGQEYIPWYAWYVGSDVFGQTEKLVPQPNNVRDFYETGVSLYNNINFQTAGVDHAMRLSFTNENIQGLIPGTSNDRYYLSAKLSYNLGKNFKVGADLYYRTQQSVGFFSESYSNQNNSSFNQWFHRHLDMNMMKKLRDLKSPEGILGSWNHFNPDVYLQNPLAFYSANYWYNPYSNLDNSENISDFKSLNGNLNLTYILSDKFRITGYFRRNDNTSEYENKRYNILEQSGIQTYFFNSYNLGNSNWTENNYEILATYEDQIGRNFTLDLNVGGNIRENRSKSLSGYTSQGLNVPDLFTIGNSKVQTSPNHYKTVQKVRSVYARGAFGFKDMVYLEWSGRNDWSSTLPVDKNSYFYPSVGISFVFSELTQNLLPGLSYGKLRASWAQVGSDLGPYDLSLNYGVSSVQWRGNFLMGTPNNLIDPSIEPSLSTAKEIGLDLRFFVDRLGLSVTYYTEKKINEILSVPITAASGFTSKQINAGRIDRYGWEFSLNAIPLKMRDFRWDITANLGTMNNEILELAEGVESQVNGNQWLAFVNEVGGEWGAIRGGGINKDEQGRPILDGNGLYTTEVNADLGSILPDFTGGFINSFSYKNFDLRFSIDFLKGGNFASNTTLTGRFSGILDETAAINDNGMNVRDPIEQGGGVRVDGVDQSGNPITVYVPSRDYYQQFTFRRIAEADMQERTYVKMREASLGYRIPVKKLGWGNFIQGASIALVARNPWLIYSATEDFDPSEATGGYVEGAQFPSTRSIGFNLKLNF